MGKIRSINLRSTSPVKLFCGLTSDLFYLENFHLDFILPLDMCHTELRNQSSTDIIQVINQLFSKNKDGDSLLMRIKIVKELQSTWYLLDRYSPE